MQENKQKAKKLNKKAIIISIIIIAIIVIAVIMILTNNKKNETTQNNGGTPEQETAEYSLIDMNNTENAEVKEGVKENTSTKLAEEKTFKKMKVKNIKLVAEGGITRFTATVENTTGNNYEGGGITIIFTNQDGSEYSRLETILPPIDAGKSNDIDAGTTADIANAYNFTIE